MYLSKVVSGMVYLQEHQIMHRDLTLSNILLDSDENVKIADFGLATQLRPEEKHRTLCGTPNYISPEVATRSSQGLEADVWSLGCMLFDLLVGRPPFDTNGVRLTLTKVVICDYKIPNIVSDTARDLISRCLQKDPSHRITLKMIINHPFMTGELAYQNQPALWQTTDSGLCTMNSSQGVSKLPFAASHSLDDKQTQSSHSSVSQPVLVRSNQQELRQNAGAVGSLKSKFCVLPQYKRCNVQESDVLGPSLCNKQNDVNSDHKCAGYRTDCGSGTSRSYDNAFLSTAGIGENCCHSSHCSCHGSKSESVCSCRTQNAASEFLLPKARSFTEQNCEKSNSEVMMLRSINSNSLSCCHGVSHHRSWCGKMNSDSIGNGVNSGRLCDNEVAHQSTSGECLFSSSGAASRPAASNSNIHSHKSVPQSVEKVPPLNTYRLKKTRQRTKNAILSIADCGEVYTEFIRSIGNKERVVDVFCISRDGIRIIFYKPNGTSGIPVQDHPPEIPKEGAEHIFSYENLPQKYWKKYAYAYRFVSVVKSKTPKVTFYSDEAKCILMENGPGADFEALFYNDCKVVMSNNEVVITYSSGHTHKMLSDQLGAIATTESLHRSPLLHCIQIRDHLWHIEKVLDELMLQSDHSCFPVIIGRRPDRSNRSENKENLSPVSVQSYRPLINASQQIGPYSSMQSLMDNSKDKAILRQRYPTDSPSVLSEPILAKNYFFDGIGWATSSATNGVSLEFLDGTSMRMCNNLPRLEFQESHTAPMQVYSTDAPLPKELKERFEKLCKVVGLLAKVGHHKYPSGIT